MSDFISSMSNYVKSGFKNVSEEIRNNRLSICHSCEFFNESLNQCKQCGCFLAVKASWATEKCPLDRWQAETITNEQNKNNSNNVGAASPPGDCGCGKK